MITNSILWGNTAITGPEINNNLDSYPIVTCCDIDQDGYDGSNGNIREDPLFVDPDNGDFNLSENSPCIDVGDNNAPELPLTDLDGKPRIINGVVDIGAYEYPHFCKSDFNDDGDVDGSDLAVFATDFGRTDCSADCEGDFDNDNDVDGSDLAVFAAEFGRTDCP